MTTRRLSILLLAAVLAIAGSMWVSSHRQTNRSELAENAVLPDLKGALNKITEVRLSKADGSKTTLRKAQSGWMVAEREFAADSARVRKLLLDLAALQVVEEKTSDPASYSQLGVEAVDKAGATGTRVEVAAPDKTYALILGKASGAKSGFVRVADAKQSLLASPRPAVEADPKEWLDRTIVNIPESRVQEVQLRPSVGPAYTISRPNKEQKDFTVSNIPRKRKLTSADAANPIAGGLDALSLDDVRASSAQPGAAEGKAATADKSSPKAAAKGASKDVSQATFKTFDGLMVDLVGRKADDKHFITVSARSTAKETADESKTLNARLTGREFEISSYKYEAIFRPLDDLLEKP